MQSGSSSRTPQRWSCPQFLVKPDPSGCPAIAESSRDQDSFLSYKALPKMTDSG